MTAQTKHRYAHISSIKELRHEETRLQCEVLLAEKSIELKLTELRYELDPKRLMTTIGEKVVVWIATWFNE